MSTERGGAKVPAWKRLGLKLKQPAAPDSANGVGQPSSSPHPQAQPGNKRRFDAPPVSDSNFAKRPRRDDVSTNRNSSLRQPKSVSFGDTPTKSGLKQPATKPATPATPKKIKGPAKKQTPSTTDLVPALEYLRQWRDSRESWKFNKNHQSALIKHAFDQPPNGIPAADLGTFYEYIRDLKGFVRTRLRETAMEFKNKDEADSSKGFPEGTKELDVTQNKYESLLAELLQPQQPGNKRKAFNETEYVANAQEGPVIIQRIVKRMRAEMVLDELSDSGESDMSTTSTSSGTLIASDGLAVDGEKRVKLNDGTAKRKRKQRTNVDSSSESDSDSDSSSDTSSSSSSGGSDAEEEEEADGLESSTSSSSSSSSSSEDSEAEGEEG